jgi:hypothetical protein
MKQQLVNENVRALKTPAWIAARWSWNVESVRRAIRQRRMESVVIGRRRLVALEEIERIENEGRIARAA